LDPSPSAFRGVQGRAHRSPSDAEDVRDRPVVEIGVVAEEENEPLALWKKPDRRPESRELVGRTAIVPDRVRLGDDVGAGVGLTAARTPRQG
jgi:hypothetical protein